MPATLLPNFIKVTQSDNPGGSPAQSTASGAVRENTVLVVEDNVSNFVLIARMLGFLGIHCEWKTSGYEVVEYADTLPRLDLILMDIQMPGKDGIAAIQEIRRLPAGARLPILGFTASADKSTHQRILAAGADGVLTKPLAEADLVRAIRRALRRTTPSTFQANGD